VWVVVVLGCLNCSFFSYGGGYGFLFVV